MKIAATQTDAEKLILRYVSQNKYYWWTSGIIDGDIDKLTRLSDKFAELYGTLRPAHWKAYMSRKGRARAFCVAYELPNGKGKFRWYLLVTDGTGNVRDLEKLDDARIKSIDIGDLLLKEVVRPSEFGGGSRWTYLVERRVESSQDKYLFDLVKQGKDKELAVAFRYVCGYTMHSGVRSWVRRQIRSKFTLWYKFWPNRPWPGPDPEASLPVMTMKKINFVADLTHGDRPGSADQKLVA
ncbi:hypothetical protein SHINM1_014100 [Fluviibacter phosphoraccumulans]|nr:hypothetical protein SHINM1_014100 [Fluviibacter phosphoraccumulans]